METRLRVCEDAIDPRLNGIRRGQSGSAQDASDVDGGDNDNGVFVFAEFLVGL